MTTTNPLPVPSPDHAVVAVPSPGPGKGHWAGSPTSVLDDEGTIWLAYRLRRPEGTGRGYANVVARSEDGERFETVTVLEREEFDCDSLERPSLLRLPDGGWRIYVSCATPGSKHWRVDALDADHPVAVPSRLGQDGAPRRCHRGCEGSGGEARSTASGTSGSASILSTSPRTPTECPPTTAPAPTDSTGPCTGWRCPEPRVPGTNGEPGWPRCSNGTGGGWPTTTGGPPKSRMPRSGPGWPPDRLPGELVAQPGVMGADPAGQGSLRYLSAITLPGGGVRLFYETSRRDGAHDLRTEYVLPSR